MSRTHFLHRLKQPVSAYNVAWFRIVFGFLFCFEAIKLWWDGNLKLQFVDPVFRFKYPWFEWVPIVPTPVIYLVFIIIIVCSMLVMLGVFYRPAIIGLFGCWTYVLLIDQCTFMNHYYLMALIAFLFVFIPADRVMSISDMMDKETGKRQQPDTIPCWCLLLLQFQLSIPYVFGAIYKMHSDWLGLCEPMKHWLNEAGATPLIGKWLMSDSAAFCFSWGGMLFDLLIIPAILFRKTRWIAVFAYVSFHLINTQMHNIGIFPWMMIGALPVFLRPDLLKHFLYPETKQSKPDTLDRSEVEPATDVEKAAKASTVSTKRLVAQQRAMPWGLWIFVALQIILPFRHWMYPGWVLWNDRGSHFAWNMRPKRVASGKEFLAVDHQKRAQWTIDIDELLTPFQQERFNRPEMYRQFAIGYKRLYRKKNGRNVEVYLAAFRGLNGRKPIRLIDPTVDLTKTNLANTNWILPFEESEYPFKLSNDEDLEQSEPIRK